jgi:subtilisin family serine protease
MLGLAAAALALPRRASAAAPVDGTPLLRLLGARAKDAFAPPGSPAMGVLVRLPSGVRGVDVGLRETAPGIARVWGTPATLLAFADAHPGWPIEVTPPLHTLLDTARVFVAGSPAAVSSLDGTGVSIGMADTGIDVTHGDFLDAQGHSRVAWLLDLSSPPVGLHPELEAAFGSTDSKGNLVAGAVWAGSDIDAFVQQGKTAQVPQDEIGHGTLVASCAAGNGLGGQSQYVGIAPRATILVARITGTSSESIGNDELLRGVEFLFDRADTLHQPVVVNLSIGSDFGPHDGTTAWEQTLVSFVGPQHPGRAIIAAAGNSGSIGGPQVHENVHVSAGATMRVPVVTSGADNGGVQVWVAMHAGASLRVGLDGPDGTWISPVEENQSAGKNTSDYSAAVYNGSAAGSSVPQQSHGAIVVWQKKWPAGTYSITLSGTGTADLYAQGTGDAVSGGREVGFAYGVREGTINLPATAPSIIGVGCTINKTGWYSQLGDPLGLSVPVLDARGASATGAMRDAVTGEPCWFSSAGPTLTGIEKPEIMAPGAAIIGAMSQQAIPPATDSIFTDPGCPSKDGTGTDPACQQIDAQHAVSSGTSFSSPVVAGAVALLLQHDPTLTEDEILAALQAGAHPLRHPALFEDQSGVGELDVAGALAAVDRLRDPTTALPVRAESWLTLGADTALADGSTPVQAIVELRAERPPQGAAPPADGFGEGRLAVYALIDGGAMSGITVALARRGPGVWVATVAIPPGLGGSVLRVGATFDGRDVVDPKSIPIATDTWNSAYPPRVKGGCAITPRGPATSPGEPPWGPWEPWDTWTAVVLALGLLATRLPPSGASRAAPTPPASGRRGAPYFRGGRPRRGRRRHRRGTRR